MIAPFDYNSINDIWKIKVWIYTKTSNQPFVVNIAFEKQMTSQQFDHIKKIIDMEYVDNIALSDNQIITFTKK
jgi:hypothetical protein